MPNNIELQNDQEVLSGNSGENWNSVNIMHTQWKETEHQAAVNG
jgi:hypothetical protein